MAHCCQLVSRRLPSFALAPLRPTRTFRGYSWSTNGSANRFKTAKTLLVYPGTVLAATTGLLYMKQKDNNSLLPPFANLPSSPDEKQDGSMMMYTYDEISKHDSQESGIWITYKNGVYDVTEFVNQHPGGDIIMLAAGQSVDHYWNSYPIHRSQETLNLLEEMRIGSLDTSTIPETDKEDASVEDQWANEPKERNPVLKHNQDRPFNAEPPLPILTSQFYTPNDLFYVRNHLPVPEKVDLNEYRLEVSREGAKSINLSVEELKKFPEFTISVAIQCAGNRRSQMSQVKPVRGLNWEGGAIGNAKWTGVRLCDVIKSLGLSEDDLKGVKHIQFEGLDEEPATGSNYGASIPIATALNPASQVLLAYKMNGEDIPMDHGYPIRVIVPGTVGARSVKWLSRVVLSDEESHSLWQRRDYKLFPPSVNINNVDFSSSAAIQELPIQSAICSPLAGTTIKPKDEPIVVKGYAFSGGGRAITRVDVSIDGGQTWLPAGIQADPDQTPGQAWSWSLWEAKIPASLIGKGEVDICCRAFDSACNTQPEKTESIWNFRGLCNNSWHHVKVHVS